MGLVASVAIGLAAVSGAHALSSASLRNDPEVAASIWQANGRAKEKIAYLTFVKQVRAALRQPEASTKGQVDRLPHRDARDAELALAVVERDQVVDDFYDSVFRTLVTYMVENPKTISECAHLLFIAKNIERIGDHATNVAEMVYYAATGQTLPERERGGTQQQEN